MGVALRQAEQAAENRASSHPASTAGVQIRVDKEEYIGLGAGRRRTGRPVTGRRSKGKPTSSVTMKSCGLEFESWKAVFTVVEARVWLARARARPGARSHRALVDSSRGVGAMVAAAWRGSKPARKWRSCPKSSRSVPAADDPWIRFRGQTRPRWWRSRPESGVG